MNVAINYYLILSYHTLATNPDNPMTSNSHHMAVMSIMGDVPTIILLHPCQNYLAL